MSVKVRRSWCMLSVIGSVVLASTMLVQVVQVEAKKPIPPPPPDPPVEYLITWLDRLGRERALTEDMNNAGNVVGSVYDYVDLDGGYYTNRTAFVYVASLDQVIDLNEMINGMLDDDDPSFDGWTATSANGINDLGQIAGSAENDVTGETRGFMFDPQGPLCVLLPQPLNGPGQTAVKINNLSDIVATEEGGWKTQYEGNALDGYALVGSWLRESSITAFNDRGQILLSNGLRYTPGAGWEDFSATYDILFAVGMNNDGTFVGSREKKERGTRRFSFRFTDGSDGNPAEMLDIMANVRSAWDVNSHGDVCITDVVRAHLYMDDHGLWALDDMVIGATADVENWTDSSITYATDISDRDATGFGSISGYAYKITTIDKKTTTRTMTAFILTPVLP